MNIKFLIILFLLYFGTISNSEAQIASVFDDFIFGDSVIIVKKSLTKITDSLKVIEISNPNFPLSKYKETHLIAYSIRLKTGVLNKAIFTFSDDGLCYIEAKGNVRKVFGANRNDNSQAFMDYQVFPNDLLFINFKRDAAWILTPESTHPNLFTWNNPLLINPDKPMTYNSSAKMPEFIKMGGSLKTQLPNFERASQIVQVDTLDGTDPNAQIQINAYGIEYAGFPRKFEARFGNDKLKMVWVLTSKGEEGRIRKKLIEAYGKPIFINNNWEFFENWTIALRKDKPEVLFLTEELGRQYEKSLNQ